MSDGVLVGRSTSFTVSAIAAGILCASMWMSVVLSPAFLIPLQIAFGKLGRRGGIAAIGSALLALVLGFMVQSFSFKEGLALFSVLSALPAPLALIAVLFILNTALFSSWAPVSRILALAAILSVAAAPFVAGIFANAGLRSSLAASVSHLVEGFMKGVDLGEQGYDSAALLASLDPASMVASSFEFFASGFAALVFAFLGMSWWIGNRLSGPDSTGRRATGLLSETRIPAWYVWPFLASGAMLLLSLRFDAGTLARSIAWNLVLIFSCAYLAQGLGIVAHFLARWKVPNFLRIVTLAMATLSALTSPLGLAFAAILTLLGVTELWIPYRNAKGVGA